LVTDSKEEAEQYKHVARDYMDLLEREGHAYAALITSPEERAIWDRFWEQWQAYVAQSGKYTSIAQDGQDALKFFTAHRDEYVALSKALQEEMDLNVKASEAEATEADQTYSSSRSLIVTLIMAAVACGAMFAFFVGRAVSKPLRDAVGALKRISEGHLDNTIEAHGHDEAGKLLAGLDEMQSKLRAALEAERAAAAANSRIKSALDRASASVMVADEKLQVIYANESAQRLFRAAETDLRRDLHSLNAGRLIGSSVDALHKNPAQQRQLLATLQGTHTDDVTLGGRSMRTSASPVIDSDGRRCGTVLEWWDRTQEVHSEEEVGAVVKSALEGNLTVRVELQGKSGFHAALARGLNELLDNVAAIIRKISATSMEVHKGADEISAGNTNLSQRTEEQSSSLEETASSMEEMTTTVKQNADNAGQANQLAIAARDQAERGGAVVGKAVSAMSEINEASKRIADIIGVIDDIAFQTNLLALNAAVEAARAGEQGRGFAVVASEVRSLAGRSATAAKEIKDLIQDSVRKVEDGSVLVTQSGQTLEQIMSSIKKVSDIVAEIAAASREQSAGIEQVNRAVMQMDELTQQNAALVEQATAASQAMAEQARDLNQMLELYQLGDVEPSASTTTTQATPRAAVAQRLERRNPARPWASRDTRPSASAGTTAEDSPVCALPGAPALTALREQTPPRGGRPYYP